MKQGNRCICFFSMLCMLYVIWFSYIPIKAAEIVDEGKWGDNITWTLDDEGTITFSGKGKMKRGTNSHETAGEYGTEVFTWSDHLLEIKKIVIKNGIINVPNGAFDYGYNDSVNRVCKVVSVVLPSTVTEIGVCAFYRCKKLKKINLPSNLKKIGASAFGTCISLDTITIPSKIKTIERGTFNGCNLKKVILPKNVKKIGESAFSSCDNLTKIVIPKNVKSIGAYAFANCDSLEFVKFEKNTNKEMTIGKKIFLNCKNLKTVLFPNNVKELRFTFKNCSSLESVKLPKNLEVMAGTFSKCTSLEKITIPAKVKQLDDETFYKCKNLKKIVIKSQKLNFDNAYKPHVTYKGIAKDAWILIPASKYDLYKENIMLSAPETVRIKGR